MGYLYYLGHITLTDIQADLMVDGVQMIIYPDLSLSGLMGGTEASQVKIVISKNVDNKPSEVR